MSCALRYPTPSTSVPQRGRHAICRLKCDVCTLAATPTQLGTGITVCGLHATSWRVFWDWPLDDLHASLAASPQVALSTSEQKSPLARRPDLRHACASTWLNAGVAAPQVAAWAGHGVDVLLRIYAKTIEGQKAVARQRVQDALVTTWTTRSSDAIPTFGARRAPTSPELGHVLGTDIRIRPALAGHNRTTQGP